MDQKRKSTLRFTYVRFALKADIEIEVLGDARPDQAYPIQDVIISKALVAAATPQTTTKIRMIRR